MKCEIARLRERCAQQASVIDSMFKELAASNLVLRERNAHIDSPAQQVAYVAGLLNSQELVIDEFAKQGDVQIPPQNQVVLVQHCDMSCDAVE